MRVWQVNENDWVAGPTILSALRAGCRSLGVSWRELIDRDYFNEVQPTEWASIGVYDEEHPDDYSRTLFDIVAEMTTAGVVFSGEYQ